MAPAATEDENGSSRWSEAGSHYNLLEGTDLGLLVVNARHIKAVPGRKTDVKDAEWIAISFAAYVAAAFVPQLLAAVGVGALLASRTHRRVAGPSFCLAAATPTVEFDPTLHEKATRLALAGGAVAAIGAIAAVAVGLAGGDVAPVFGIATAIVAACAIASERPGTRPLDLARSIPPGGVAIVGIAAIAIGPMAGRALLVPDPQMTLTPMVALPIIALVGGLLAATVNNLPAAAFGAIWLEGGSPEAILAFLIGTNLIAIGTPHGSLATIRCQRLAARQGIRVGTGTYLGTAWRYASAAGLPALGALLIAR